MNRKKDTVNNDVNPFIKTSQLNKFLNGKGYRSYTFMGAVPAEYCGEKGYSFTVWAPNAQSVSVVGDFNGWDTNAHVMHPQESTGVWNCFIKNVQEGQCYKYCIKCKDGTQHLKADPYARYAQLPPETASVTYDTSDFEWTDKKWMDKRKKLCQLSRKLQGVGAAP